MGSAFTGCGADKPKCIEGAWIVLLIRVQLHCGHVLNFGPIFGTTVGSRDVHSGVGVREMGGFEWALCALYVWCSAVNGRACVLPLWTPWDSWRLAMCADRFQRLICKVPFCCTLHYFFVRLLWCIEWGYISKRGSHSFLSFMWLAVQATYFWRNAEQPGRMPESAKSLQCPLTPAVHGDDRYISVVGVGGGEWMARWMNGDSATQKQSSWCNVKTG